MRRVTLTAMAFTVVCAGLLWFGWPVALGGQTAYVTTHGDSMEPRFRTGDLAVIRASDDYQAGDVAAYHSDLLQTVVMHRIVSVEGGRYTFQGDNNSWVDPEQPTRNQLIGTLAVHIPQGGVWLERLTAPPMLALTAFALIISGGAVRAQRRRKRRKANMSRHTNIASRPSLAWANLTKPIQGLTAATAILAVLGATLGALAWSGPLDQVSTADLSNGARMQFSYSAEVGQTPAYDGTVAQSPDPVFRALTDTVDVHFAYQGEPGEVSVTARISTPDGWHSTIPLTEPVSFSADQYEGTVQLDMKAIEAKALAAAEVTGSPAGTVSIAVTPVVETSTGQIFQPSLNLSLTPLQLTLIGETKDLTVANTAAAVEPQLIPFTLGPDSLNLTASTARAISAGLLLTAMITGAIALVLARRMAPVDEGASIRRRYAALLIRVHPITTPQGRPVIDVTTFATLAKLR